MKKNSKHLIFLVILFFISFYSRALPTFIDGKVINGNGMVIRISTYSDQISFQEELLDIHEIDAGENFRLGFEVFDIKEVFVQIGNQRFSFFAQAGKSYQLEIDNVEIPPKSAMSEQKSLHLKWSEKNSLNEVIDNFNFSFNAFLEENFIALYKYRDAKLLQSFEDEMNDKLFNTIILNKTEKVFFDNYVAYKFAILKNASRTVSEIKLGETYLQNNAVLYNHPIYMQFFNQYFSQYFVGGKRNTNYHDFIDLIRKGASKTELLDYLGKDQIPVQERLRELLLLHALKEVFYNKDFVSSKIEILIKQISKTSKFPEHQKIGSNILNQLSRMQIGASAPTFKLKSTNGIIKSLDDYKGRYVYLVFMADYCQACESDLDLLKRIDEKYNQNIALVSVLVNFTKKGLDKFTGETNNKFDMLLFANDFELLNNYRVRNFPLYILLDRDGKILLYPAKNPHEGIDRYFDFLIKRDKEKEKKPDILFFKH